MSVYTVDAVLFVSTGSAPSIDITIPYVNISTSFTTEKGVCLYDLYTGAIEGPIDPRGRNLTAAGLGAHDSHFVCVGVPPLSDNGEQLADCNALESRGGCPV